MGCGTRQEPWHGAAKLFCRRDQAFFWRTTGDCLLSGSRQPCLQSRNRRDAMAGVCPGCLRATGGRAVASGGSSPNFMRPQYREPQSASCLASARTLLPADFSCVSPPSSMLFGILADLPDSKTKDAPEDEKYIAAVQNALDELNRKYAGGFFSS